MINLNPANAQVDQVGQIYFNGLPTIARKTMLALENTSGIMIWELGQDHLGEFSLLKRIDETITGFLTTSIPSEMEDLEIKVFPNPVVDRLQIRLDQLQNLELTLFSAAAQMLHSPQLQGQTNLSIEMSNFPSGIYYLNVKSDQAAQTIKLVKSLE